MNERRNLVRAGRGEFGMDAMLRDRAGAGMPACLYIQPWGANSVAHSFVQIKGVALRKMPISYLEPDAQTAGALALIICLIVVYSARYAFA